MYLGLASGLEPRLEATEGILRRCAGGRRGRLARVWPRAWSADGGGDARGRGVGAAQRPRQRVSEGRGARPRTRASLSVSSSAQASGSGGSSRGRPSTHRSRASRRRPSGRWIATWYSSGSSAPTRVSTKRPPWAGCRSRLELSTTGTTVRHGARACNPTREPSRVGEHARRNAGDVASIAARAARAGTPGAMARRGPFEACRGRASAAW